MAQAKVKDFVVNISKLTRAVNQRGFGLIMIYSTEIDADYGLYSDISAVSEVFPVESATYKIAQRIFGQKPRPQQVAIFGNTQTEEKPAINATLTLEIKKLPKGASFTVNGITIKVLGKAENPDINKNEIAEREIDNLKHSDISCEDVVEILNRELPDYEVSINPGDVNCVVHFREKIFDSHSYLDVKSDGGVITTHYINTVARHASGFIGSLNTVREMYPDAFFLVCTDNTNMAVKKLSNWIDTQEMMYFVTSQDLHTASLVRSENTVVMYHDDDTAFAAEGLASYLATAKVGGVTAKFKEIKGVNAAHINLTQFDNLHKMNGFTYIEKMGLLETSEGKTTSGEYIDVVMGAYWIQFKMEEGLAYLAANTPKIGFDNKGITKMVAVCNDVLRRAAFEQDIILIDPDGNAKYEITYVPRELTDPNDVANRNYTGIKWTAKLAGAIHKAVISGVLEY